MSKPRVFVAYAAKDEDHFRRLERHLSVLIRQEKISFQHHNLVLPGQEMRLAEQMLAEADVVVLLVSADFLHSDFGYREQMEAAMKRHERREARVIPVILRACTWEDAPIGGLSPLPANRVPVALWGDEDEAWSSVVLGIRASMRDLVKPSKPPPKPEPPSPRPRDEHVPDDHPAGAPPPVEADAPSLDILAVRAAYRRINAYHDHLRGVLRQALQATTIHLGKLRSLGWKPDLFDLPESRKSPLDQWVYDYQPLAHAHLSWATAQTPNAGAVLFSAWHCGDTALEKERRDAPEVEPRVFDLTTVAEASTTLSFYVVAVVRLSPRSHYADWDGLDALINDAAGHQESLWTDETIHQAPIAGLIHYGGFQRDMAQLQTREDVDRLVVTPLLRLIEEARKPVSG